MLPREDVDPAWTRDEAATIPAAVQAAASEPSASTVSGQTLALPSGPATVGGSGDGFSAESSTGTGSLAVPLELQPARGDVQPTLSLSYSTSGGAGVAGMGWGLGTQYIARQVDRGVPGYRDAAAYDVNQDRFVFNGGELVPIGTVQGARVAGAPSDEVMPPWAEGWQYFRPRVEGQYARVFWSPDHRTWRVQAGHGGVTLEFGVPLDGKNDTNALETATEGDRSRIFRWNLARSYDTTGTPKPQEAAQPRPPNVVVYRYLSDGGIGYLTDIYDTPPAANAAAPLSQYAHHTRISYQIRPDELSNYRRGFRTVQALRVRNIDLTSKPAGASVDVARRQVRRVWLDYQADSRLSLLSAVRTEGRCSGVETNAAVPLENASEKLPDVTGCRQLPPLTFSYTATAGSSLVVAEPGLTPLSRAVSSFSGSPPNALEGGAGMALIDFNGDGLPDVLDGDSAKLAGKHRVYLNGQGNQLASLSQPTTVSIPTVSGATGSATGFDLSLKNPNVVPLDFDSNGSVDLVFMPRLRRPIVFSARTNAGAPQWAGRVPEWALSQTTSFELANVAASMRTVDVNGDGFIDLIQTSGSELLTYYSLSGFPGGDGKFGQAIRVGTGAGTLQLSLEPIHACLPGGNGLLQLNDPQVKLGDLNGDGLVDLIRARRGTLEYWPGRGDGRYGAGDLTNCRSPNVAPPLLMSSAPIPLVSDQALQFGDVDGDGLADAFAMEATSITVWLNKSGTSFAKPVSIPKPVTATNRAAVQLGDINGSGTSDVVFGDAGNYRYIDLLGGARPNLLASFESGYGKTTQIEYSTSTQEMLAAAAAGRPWSSSIPAVVPLVKRIVIKDNLDKIGRPAGIYTTEYEYRDPSYDPRDRAFRGFREVLKRSPAAAGVVTQGSRSVFLTGECVDEATPGQCAKRDFDNPREALKGLATSIDVFNSLGEYLSTTATTYRIRTLYTGMDGRQVRAVFPVASDVYKYETSPYTAAQTSVSVVAVEREATPGVVVAETGATLLLRSNDRVHLRDEMTVNREGQTTLARSRGCMEGCTPVDEVIDETSVMGRVPGDQSGWLYRKLQSWTVGSVNTAKRNQYTYSYDAAGRTTQVSGTLTGTLPLVRTHAAGGAIAPAPPQASVDGVIVVQQQAYDDLGRITSVRSGIGRCTERKYDARYGLLTEQETSLAGVAGPDGCGTVRLTKRGVLDFGFQVALEMFGVNGERSRVEIDEFGRLTRTFAPHPVTLGSLSPLAALEYTYLLPTGGKPVFGIRTRTHRGAAINSNTYVDSYDYADSLGRGLMTIVQADPGKGDGGQWIVKGLPEYDSLGRQSRGYMPWFWNGDPLVFPVAVPAGTASEVRTYDNFGRFYQRWATDGVLVARTLYHPLSTDVWDAEDLSASGPHSGTYATAQLDGHGRTKAAISRYRVSGVMRQLEEKTEFLPTGEPLRFSRTLLGTSTPVVARWMRYDSLGRLVLNAEPNTSTGFVNNPSLNANSIKTWRYAYNDVGDLVGMSDARGCGVNLFYDAGGRPLGVDRSPCLATQPAYSPVDLATGAGAETWKRYDAADSELSSITAAGCPAPPAAWLGKLASSETLGAKTVSLTDGRGRATCTATRLAKPDAGTTGTRSYAPRWYARVTDYDAANRVVASTTGARSPELLGSGAASRLTFGYSLRDQLYSVGGSYGALLTKRELDVTGRPKKVVYGDLAKTQTDFSYDARHRLASVQTTRVAPTLWRTPSGQYQPPTDVNEPVRQTVLENSQVTYDDSDNPTGFYDLRDPADWPARSKPVHRYVEYDDLNRVKRVQYDYGPVADAWRSPYAQELSTPRDPSSPRHDPAPHVSFAERFKEQSFEYDHLGNLSRTDDDAHGFFDRSLGTQTVGTAALGPYRLKTASNRAIAGVGPRAGNLDTRYDASGNLTDLLVLRDGPCLPETASCKQRFSYEWDEVGQLTRARRFDLASSELATSGVLTGPLPARAADVELRYSFGQDGARVLKTAIDPAGQAIHDAYIFDSLELRRARFDTTSGEYELTAQTENVRLSAKGSILGRVYYAQTDVPRLVSGSQHVFLEFHDHLGSSTAVIDYATSELVEGTSYAAYGQTESDYRPARWASFREDYKFTGKEEDIEVGLTCVGVRFYSPQMGRFISPDPLAVHKPGGADQNVYAYVSGRTFAAVDPDGQLLWFIPILVAAAVAAATSAGTQYAAKGHIDWGWKGVAGAALAGAVAGAVSGGAAILGAGIWSGAAGGAAGAMTTAALNKQNGGQILVAGLLGGATGLGGAALSGQLNNVTMTALEPSGMSLKVATHVSTAFSSTVTGAAGGFAQEGIRAFFDQNYKPNYGQAIAVGAANGAGAYVGAAVSGQIPSAGPAYESREQALRAAAFHNQSAVNADSAAHRTITEVGAFVYEWGDQYYAAQSVHSEMYGGVDSEWVRQESWIPAGATLEGFAHAHPPPVPGHEYPDKAPEHFNHPDGLHPGDVAAGQSGVQMYGKGGPWMEAVSTPRGTLEFWSVQGGLKEQPPLRGLPAWR